MLEFIDMLKLECSLDAKLELSYTLFKEPTACCTTPSFSHFFSIIWSVFYNLLAKDTYRISIEDYIPVKYWIFETVRVSLFSLFIHYEVVSIFKLVN